MRRLLFDNTRCRRWNGPADGTGAVAGQRAGQAAAWLEGFLHGSGLLLLHNETLWEILDQWVAADGEAFNPLLPLLRRTFAQFLPRNGARWASGSSQAAQGAVGGGRSRCGRGAGGFSAAAGGVGCWGRPERRIRGGWGRSRRERRGDGKIGAQAFGEKSSRAIRSWAATGRAVPGKQRRADNAGLIQKARWHHGRPRGDPRREVAQLLLALPPHTIKSGQNRLSMVSR